MAEPTEAEERLARVRAWLDEAMSRGEVKRAAAEIERSPELRSLILEQAPSLPDEASTWPAKKLLRRARAREEQAHVRINPIHRDDGFTCSHCGLEVRPHGRTARDHCPRCLRSLHVDVVPGDRAAGCGGLLDPMGVEARAGDQWVIRYRCRRCGAIRHNRVLRDGDPPDDWKLVVSLSRGG